MLLEGEYMFLANLGEKEVGNPFGIHISHQDQGVEAPSEKNSRQY